MGPKHLYDRSSTTRWIKLFSFKWLIKSYLHVKTFLYSVVCFHAYIHVVTVAVTGWLRPWSRSATKLTVYSSPGLRPVCKKEVMVLGSCAVIPPSLSWEKTQTEAMWWKETGLLLHIVCIFCGNVSYCVAQTSSLIGDEESGRTLPSLVRQWIMQLISIQ